MSEAESHNYVLGPILFILFIDDIADVCCGTVKHSLYVRQRSYSFALPSRTGHLIDKNFMQRMLYLNSYHIRH